MEKEEKGRKGKKRKGRCNVKRNGKGIENGIGKEKIDNKEEKGGNKVK